MAGGRPTTYKPENAEIVRHACMLGATNEALAERFEVCRRTIDNWIATIPEFSDAVRQGRQVADEVVIGALFARATGMEQKMTKVFCYRGQPVTVDYIAHLPPDVSACFFWLRNRRPWQWRENRPFVHEEDVEEEDDDAWVRKLDASSEQARLDAIAGRPDATPAPGAAEGAVLSAGTSTRR
jgi:hypothetical protein